MGHWTDVAIPTADRDWFIRENAVSLVRELEAKLKNRGKEIHRLHKMIRSLRLELRQVRDANQPEI
jgi:hypothetical protein